MTASTPDPTTELERVKGELTGIKLALKIPQLSPKNLQDSIASVNDRLIRVIDAFDTRIGAIEARITTLERVTNALLRAIETTPAPATEDLDTPDPWTEGNGP